MRRLVLLFFFFSSRRRHTRSDRDWSSDVCSSDLFASQVREIGRLVLLALAAEQLAVLVGDMRPRALPPRHLARKGRQVLALDVVVQIGGRENEAISEELQKLFGRSSARTWGALPR